MTTATASSTLPRHSSSRSLLVRLGWPAGVAGQATRFFWGGRGGDPHHPSQLRQAADGHTAQWQHTTDWPHRCLVQGPAAWLQGSSAHTSCTAAQQAIMHSSLTERNATCSGGIQCQCMRRSSQQNQTGSQQLHPTHLSSASARALAEPAKRMPTARQAPATQQQWACGQPRREHHQTSKSTAAPTAQDQRKVQQKSCCACADNVALWLTSSSTHLRESLIVCMGHVRPLARHELRQGALQSQQSARRLLSSVIGVQTALACTVWAGTIQAQRQLRGKNGSTP